MPIRKENKGRYPPNWKSISYHIRFVRAGGRCEGAPDIYPDCRAVHGQPHPVTGSKVVLTTAHLNPPIENCAESNLRALCQRCHLAYDAKARGQTVRERMQDLMTRQKDEALP
jgi:hypothetical protein